MRVLRPKALQCGAFCCLGTSKAQCHGVPPSATRGHLAARLAPRLEEVGRCADPRRLERVPAGSSLTIKSVTHTWVVILVGLGGGVLGTLNTTRTNISHQREVELRSRMLEAADNYVRAVDEASRVLGSARMPVLSGSVWVGSTSQRGVDFKENSERAKEAASAAVSNVSPFISRIRLLFGPDSATTSQI